MTDYTYKATVIRWVDGDTVWLNVDLGFRITTATDFRLYGIDTPERGQPGFKEATARAAELAPVESVINIATYKNADKYGRWLVEIYLDSGETLNSILISEGHAVQYLKRVNQRKNNRRLRRR